MASGGLEKKLSGLHVGTGGQSNGKGDLLEAQTMDNDDVQITCFTEDLHDTTIHFQIIKLSKQIYAWIGCNSAKFGHLYAAVPTRPNMVGITSLLGGSADNTGSSIARHLVLKTGVSLILACNIPKDSPMLEVAAERKLMEKLKNLGYTKPRLVAAHNNSTAALC